MTTYEQALKQARKVGAAHADGDAHLAQMCSLLPHSHGPGISPKLVYNGARKRGIDGAQLMRLSPEVIERLMWE